MQNFWLFCYTIGVIFGLFGCTRLWTAKKAEDWLYGFLLMLGCVLFTMVAVLC